MLHLGYFFSLWGAPSPLPPPPRYSFLRLIYTFLAGVGNCSKKFPGQFGHDSTWCDQHLECAWCLKNASTGKYHNCLASDWQANCFCSMDPCSLADKGAGPSPPPAVAAATVTDSGLKIKIMKVAPTGAMPKASDSVKVHYEGKLEDGTVFDSSIARGEPIVFPLSGVISGWTEGLQLMHVGETALLTIPSDLAYGDRGQGPIPPKVSQCTVSLKSSD